MSNTAYVHLTGVQAQLTDMAGDAAPGGQVLYSAVVLTPQNVPVPMAGTTNYSVFAEPVTFSVGPGVSTQSLQNVVSADVLRLWGDNTLTVVFV